MDKTFILHIHFRKIPRTDGALSNFPVFPRYNWNAISIKYREAVYMVRSDAFAACSPLLPLNTTQPTHPVGVFSIHSRQF